MHKYITVLFVLLLFSCTTTKESTSGPIQKEVKKVKKGRKLFGEITLYTPDFGESISTPEGIAGNSSPNLFFKSEQDYYRITISKEGLSREEMEAQMGKELKVRGEILDAKGKDLLIGGVVAKDLKGHITIYEITPLK